MTKSKIVKKEKSKFKLTSKEAEFVAAVIAGAITYAIVKKLLD